MDRKYLRDGAKDIIEGEYFNESNPPEEVMNIDINDLMTEKNGLEVVITE